VLRAARQGRCRARDGDSKLASSACFVFARTALFLWHVLWCHKGHVVIIRSGVTRGTSLSFAGRRRCARLALAFDLCVIHRLYRQPPIVTHSQT
jgi:hypothetical protein